MCSVKGGGIVKMHGFLCKFIETSQNYISFISMHCSLLQYGIVHALSAVWTSFSKHTPTQGIKVSLTIRTNCLFYALGKAAQCTWCVWALKEHLSEGIASDVMGKVSSWQFLSVPPSWGRRWRCRFLAAGKSQRHNKAVCNSPWQLPRKSITGLLCTNHS